MLKVISQLAWRVAEPVFEAVLEKAVGICQAKFGNMFLYRDGSYRIGAQLNAPPAYAERWREHPVFVVGDNRHNPLDRLAKTKQLVNIVDLAAEPAPIVRAIPRFVALVEGARARTHLLVPMLKETELAVGAINIYRQVGATLHRQANRTATELRRPSRHRHREHAAAQRTAQKLSLEQQTATSEVLKVIC